MVALERILTTSDLASAFQAQCLQALTRREHSQQELLAKKSSDLALEEAQHILNLLIENGWQSDERYCQNYVQSKANSGHGAMKIRHALRQNGISDDIISAALETIDWFELAAEVYGKKYPQRSKDRAELAKRQRFMAQRGFSFAEIRYAQSAQENGNA